MKTKETMIMLALACWLVFEIAKCIHKRMTHRKALARLTEVKRDAQAYLNEYEVPFAEDLVMMQVLEEGIRAFHARVKFESNPYPVMDNRNFAWGLGWSEARIKHLLHI